MTWSRCGCAAKTRCWDWTEKPPTGTARRCRGAPVGARLLLAVGATEGLEFHRQARALEQAWGSAGVAVEVLDLAGENHFSLAASLGNPASRLTRALVDLVGAPRG